MKKVLLLGGTQGQVYAVQTIKKLGYYAITCDNRPNNPGHKYSDEYHEVSVLDKEAVLKLSKKLKIDGIVCYALDEVALTTAYVAEKMGLPGQPVKSVEILTNKDLFRKFLKDNGFNCPKAKGYTSTNIEEAIKDWDLFKKPVMVKPVDSAGSRGVSVVNDKNILEEKIKYALSYSRNNRFLIEEYVEKNSYQIAGDGFSVDGKLVFRCFANEHFDRGGIIPIGESFPYKEVINGISNNVDEEAQRLLNLLNMRTGAYNFDVRIDNNYNVYLMELAPRNGGNLIAQVIEYATGVQLASFIIKSALGKNCNDIKMQNTKGYWSSFLIHANKPGILKGIDFDIDFRTHNIVELNIYYESGYNIAEFGQTNGTIGTMILKFSSMDDMLEKMDNMNKYIKVIVE